MSCIEDRRSIMLCETIRARVAAGILLAAFFTAGSVPALAAPIKNIVLVHGAWVDGSGWKPVYEILVRDGYHVSIVQEPIDLAAGRCRRDKADTEPAARPVHPGRTQLRWHRHYGGRNRLARHRARLYRGARTGCG